MDKGTVWKRGVDKGTVWRIGVNKGTVWSVLIILTYFIAKRVFFSVKHFEFVHKIYR